MAKEIVAMILAGGRGSRLYALTQKTAKPAVSFGGKYRIVDFPLSNCVNSNIDTVGIATQYQPQKLNEYIAVKGLRALTPHTLVTREALVNSLETIRSRGYALEDEERELGARCVAAPVRDYSGRIVGGISVSGPTTRMSRARLEALAPLVMDTAAELSRRLAYEEWPEEGD